MEIVKLESEEFWGRFIQLNTSDGKGTIKVIIDKNRRKIAEVCDFNVHESVRRQGYGTLLMQAAEKVAADMGCELVVLWVYREDWTHGWYQRVGYADDYITRRPHESVIWMSKNLKSGRT